MLKEWISTEYQKDLLEMKVRGKRPNAYDRYTKRDVDMQE
jgi:hypothetical protein